MASEAVGCHHRHAGTLELDPPIREFRDLPLGDTQCLLGGPQPCRLRIECRRPRQSALRFIELSSEYLKMRPLLGCLDGHLAQFTVEAVQATASDVLGQLLLPLG